MGAGPAAVVSQRKHGASSDPPGEAGTSEAANSGAVACASIGIRIGSTGMCAAGDGSDTDGADRWEDAGCAEGRCTRQRQHEQAAPPSTDGKIQPPVGLPLHQHPDLVAFGGSRWAFTPAPETPAHNAVVFVLPRCDGATSQESVRSLICSSAAQADTGLLGRSGARHVINPHELDRRHPAVVAAYQLLQRAAVISGGRILLDHHSAAPAWASVYANTADMERAADWWTEKTGQTVAAADRWAGHQKLHYHGPGGTHPEPGGTGHSGFQVDATRKQHLISVGCRVATGMTPFQLGFPGGKQLDVLVPPGAWWVMCRGSDGQLAVPLERAPGLSLSQRRPTHGVPAMEGAPTFVTLMFEMIVEAETMEEAVEVTARSLCTASASSGGSGISQAPWGASTASGSSGGGGGGGSGSPQASGPLPLAFAPSLVSLFRSLGVTSMRGMWAAAWPGEPGPSSFTRAVAIRVVAAEHVLHSDDAAAQALRRATQARLGSSGRERLVAACSPEARERARQEMAAYHASRRLTAAEQQRRALLFPATVSFVPRTQAVMALALAARGVLPAAIITALFQ